MESYVEAAKRCMDAPWFRADEWATVDDVVALNYLHEEVLHLERYLQRQLELMRRRRKLEA
jgi:hypothetical protein